MPTSPLVSTPVPMALRHMTCRVHAVLVAVSVCTQNLQPSNFYNLHQSYCNVEGQPMWTPAGRNLKLSIRQSPRLLQRCTGVAYYVTQRFQPDFFISTQQRHNRPMRRHRSKEPKPTATPEPENENTRSILQPKAQLIAEVTEMLKIKPEFEWWSAFANQSGTKTNEPNEERRRVTYSYLVNTPVNTPEIPLATSDLQTAVESSNGNLICAPEAAQTGAASGTPTTTKYFIRVNDRRLNLIIPPLDITNTWNMLGIDRIQDPKLLKKLFHVEKLGRNTHIIKAAQILYLQKYQLEPPPGVTLQKLETTFKKELQDQSLDTARLILETVTTETPGKNANVLAKTTRDTLTSTHHTLFTYLGFATIEDPQLVAPQLVYRLLKRCKNEHLKQHQWDSQLVEFDVENLNALLKIDRELKEYIQPLELNAEVLSSILRPAILTFNDQTLRLPALPNILKATKFPYLLQLIFNPTVKTAPNVSPQSLPLDLQLRLHKISDSLDKIGDRVLSLLSQEYFLQRSLSFENLTNSNALLCRLVYLYDFPRVNNVLRENIDRLNQHSTKKNKVDELLGDIFEKFLAVMFITDSKACITWLFKVFDTIQEAVMISLYQKDVQDFTNRAQLSPRFKPVAPHVNYISREIGQEIENYVSHLVRVRAIEATSASVASEKPATKTTKKAKKTPQVQKGSPKHPVKKSKSKAKSKSKPEPPT